MTRRVDEQVSKSVRIGVFSPLLSSLPPYFFGFLTKAMFQSCGKTGETGRTGVPVFSLRCFSDLGSKILDWNHPRYPSSFFSFFLCSDSFPHVVSVFWIMYWPLVRKCLLSCFLEAALPKTSHLPLFCGIATRTKTYSVNLVFKDNIFAMQTNLSFSGVPSFFLFAPRSLLHDIPVVFFWWTKNWGRWRNGLVRDPSTAKRSLKHENCCFKKRRGGGVAFRKWEYDLHDINGLRILLA